MEQFQGDFPVDGVIFRQQQPGAGMAPTEFGLGVCRADSRGGGEDAAPPLQPGGEPEGAAHAGLALDPDLAVHQLRQRPGDGQPQPGAAVLTGDRGIGLFEGFEEPGLLLQGEAMPVSWTCLLYTSRCV